MDIFIVIFSIVVLAIELWMVWYLSGKIKRMHKLSIKDTAIYPAIILISIGILLLAKFNFGPDIDSAKNEITALDKISSSLKSSVSIAAMVFDGDTIKALISNGSVPSISLIVAYIGIYVISGLALLSISISLTWINIKNFCGKVKNNITSLKFKEIDYVFGFKDDCKEYLKNHYLDFNKEVVKKSDKYIELKQKNKEEKDKQKKKAIKKEIKDLLNPKHRLYVVLDRSTIDKHEDEKFYLHKYRIPFVSKKIEKTEDFEKTIIKLSKKKKKKIKFISFIDDDKKLFDFANVPLKIIKKEEKIYKKAFEALENKKKEYINKYKKAFEELENKKEECKNKYKELYNELLRKEAKYLNKYDVTRKIEFIIVANIEQERFLNNMIYERNINDKLSVTVDNSNGLIKIINKYDLISRDFACNYNFARYLSKDEIDIDLTVKDCDINLYMFGFGKVNQALLRDILVCNQFVEKIEIDGKYKLQSKKINVVVFEANSKAECFELTNTFIKFDKKSYINKKRYFDIKDDYLSHIDIRKGVSIYGDSFIKSLFDEINIKAKTKKPGKNKPTKQVNYFVVSLDSDFTNSDVALKISNNINHIENTKNYYFVRLKDIMYDVKNYIHPFGSNRNTLTYDNVVQNHIVDLAKSAAYEYNDKDKKSVIDKENSWRELSPLKMKSNYYVAYGMYFKLSLVLTQSELKIDEINKNDLNKELKKILENYEIIKFKDEEYNKKYERLVGLNDSYNMGMVLAFLEHERWNAYEISQGALPMSIPYAKNLNLDYVPVLIDKIEKEYENNKSKTEFSLISKSGDELYHMNISSHDGLVDYLLFMDELKDYINEKYNDLFKSNKYEKIREGIKFDENIIKYDFDSMNGIYYYLFPDKLKEEQEAKKKESNEDKNSEEKSYANKETFINKFIEIYGRK